MYLRTNIFSTALQKVLILDELVNSYLLKDILELENVKGSKILLDLLRLLAYQVGNEVSLTELAKQIRISLESETIDVMCEGRNSNLFSFLMPSILLAKIISSPEFALFTAP